VLGDDVRQRVVTWKFGGIPVYDGAAEAVLPVDDQSTEATPCTAMHVPAKSAVGPNVTPASKPLLANGPSVAPESKPLLEKNLAVANLADAIATPQPIATVANLAEPSEEQTSFMGTATPVPSANKPPLVPKNNIVGPTTGASSSNSTVIFCHAFQLCSDNCLCR